MSKENVVKMMENADGVEVGKMFGMPAYKHNGKVFGYAHEDGLLLKVGKDRASQLIEQNPHMHEYEAKIGRVWKDWVKVDYDHADNVVSEGLVKEAQTFANK